MPVWKNVADGSGTRYLCQACGDGRTRELKHCAEHEASAKHKSAVAYYRSLRQDISSPQAVNSNVEERTSQEIFDCVNIDGDDYMFDDDSTYPRFQQPTFESQDDEDSDIEEIAYSIEPTELEAIISRMTSTLTEYSITGPSINSTTYSDDSDNYDEHRTDSSTGT